MIGFYFIQDKYRYTFSSNNKKEKELNIINQEKMNEEENKSLLTKKKNDSKDINMTNVSNNKMKIIYKKILNYIFLSCVILYKL
jgi:hypothetical protein